jgi:uncharacterized membrane protein YqjE
MKIIVLVVLHVIVLLIAAWDLIVLYHSRPEHTLSSLLRELAYDYPIIPFAFGVLMGHLFWCKR